MPAAGFPYFRFGLGLGLAFAIGFLAGTRQGWVEERDGRGAAPMAARKKVLNREDGRYVEHGPYEGYYPNSGKLREAGEYFMGQKHGIWTEWHENGRMKRKGRYVDGKEQPPWQQWDENGNEVKK